MNEIIKEILNNRGIKTEEIDEFLSTKPKLTYSPMLLPDIEEGVNLILDEIKKNSKIIIYGDYDADGITSTSLMYTVLSKLTLKENISYYIPSRFEEGYGLNKEAVKSIKDQGFDFIITVDCGSVSYEEVELAKELGMRILVTDHHTITDKMANCLVINPKRPDSKYPFKELSGCGVAFKVCQRLREKTNLDKSILTEVLDLVLIGTVGDIMPLIDENRTLVKYGLRVINSGNRLGLNKLIEGVGLKKGEITSENIGFVIVPHLNASGRITHASLAVELMLSNDEEKINEIVLDLIEKNKERKRLQENAYENALKLIGNNIEKFNIIRLDNEHEGILGIVAGKLKDTYNRPVCIVSPIKDEEKKLKGTGRSIEAFDIYLCLKKYDELFEKFGGHSGACGFTISEDNLVKLNELITEDMKSIPDSTFIDNDKFDLELEKSELTLPLAKELRMLAPFGKANTKPKFLIKVNNIKKVITMGEGKHFKFIDNNITYILFNRGREYDIDRLIDNNLSLIGSFDYQVYKGENRLQFVIDKIYIND